MAKLLLLAVGILVAVGVVLLLAPRIPWVGRLPGDIVVRRPGLTLYLPLATSLPLSLGLTAVLFLMHRFRR